MSTPEGKQQEGSAAPATEERRKGEDRRQGDRRTGDERRSGISVNRKFRSQSFFDHPLWVAGTILVGVALGVGLMSVKSWDATTHRPNAIEMKVVPGTDTETPH